MSKSVNEARTYSIPAYNFESLIKSITRTINLARAGKIDPGDAIDEIVRAYEDHSA
jgi:hypothetical protein